MTNEEEFDALQDELQAGIDNMRRDVRELRREYRLMVFWLARTALWLLVMAGVVVYYAIVGFPM